MQNVNLKGIIEEEADRFLESVKNIDHFAQFMRNFDQKQKDLVVRGLIHYRNKKFGAKVDKAVGVTVIISVY